eukprot:gnl/Spiro4/10238_TR5441_c0_g1_i1.p1 gnl/Spiro4/10238_TR5441_c0_g1~~gnl/Spiro4/10238_TR5441_c0_g1_i1.p1  ORF type:complete len:673 (+),score=103.06 gnl/Spiro4/10238_TR5441_c0_g1_i1:115-2133(+)
MLLLHHAFFYASRRRLFVPHHHPPQPPTSPTTTTTTATAFLRRSLQHYFTLSAAQFCSGSSSAERTSPQIPVSSCSSSEAGESGGAVRYQNSRLRSGLHVPPLSEFLRENQQNQTNDDLMYVVPPDDFDDNDDGSLDIQQQQLLQRQQHQQLKHTYEESNPLDDSTTDVSASSERTTRKVFVETYGCQMNVADTEVVSSLLSQSGYAFADDLDQAEVVLVNTCAIRDNAEQKVWQRLREFRAIQNTQRRKMTVGVLGCMAERLKQELVEAKLADVVAGPDAYRDLPRLLSLAAARQPAINVQLSMDETYANVEPLRLNSNGVTAFVSITRGCNNMCSYCIVPYTRGRERSRNVHSILDEIRQLADKGYKEVTLLGQNVNSYNDEDSASQDSGAGSLTPGFSSLSKTYRRKGVHFDELLSRIARAFPEMRVRFTSPHPKDFPRSLLEMIAEHPNIARSLHLPAQSGNDEVLSRMRRGYTRQSYLELIASVRAIIPGCAISSDFISGFCGETEEQHADTLSLMDIVKYDMAYMFAYSKRDKTHAARHFQDDVPPEVKQRRLQEVIDRFRLHARSLSECELGSRHLVLVEGPSKRHPESHLSGRTDTNKRVNFKNTKVPALDSDGTLVDIKPGDYVECVVEWASPASMGVTVVGRNTLQRYSQGLRVGHEILNFV